MFKRILDVSLALPLLLLASPLLIVCAILVKLDSRGPVFFRQTRVGRGFRPFRVLKLRTMEDHNRGAHYTLGADPRVTRVGSWLRTYKLDELPQLWNVVRGDMSLVGPRPVIPELTYEFYRSYEKLLRVRPGLTDPASLKYCHESEMLQGVPDPLVHFKRVVTPDKLRLSAEYLARATVWSDLQVMTQTATTLLAQFAGAQTGDRYPASSEQASGTFSDHTPPLAESGESAGIPVGIELSACAEESAETGD